MFLIVGLGNPGTKYDNTHHNIGFEVIDCLAQRWGVSFLEKHKGLLGSSDRAQGRVFLLKPQTFMNLSGESVVPVAQFYKIPLEHTLVLYDDLDLPAGTIRIRKTGGSGGHNGMKSLIQLLGSEDFPRVRIGIGRPVDGVAHSHVLGKIGSQDRKLFSDAVALAADAVQVFLELGIETTMNRFNGRTAEGTSTKGEKS